MKERSTEPYRSSTMQWSSERMNCIRFEAPDHIVDSPPCRYHNSRMSRAERLLQLLQVLRRYRRPVSGQTLANELCVSTRTLYRDIASLQAQGAMIEGAPGIGYVMKPGFMLPPIMFRSEELDALVLGMRWVADRCDETLSGGALGALAKIAAVLPAELRRELEESSLLVGAPLTRPAHTISPDLLRAAVRAELKLEITYVDGSGIQSRRVVWPFALVYFDQARVLMCWCELRADFRNFRSDRILSVEQKMERYPKRRSTLLREWRKLNQAASRTILPESDSMAQ
ncbi:putative DNA-binding transcriptional regulator YafY [Paraburkholderia youngii]